MTHVVKGSRLGVLFVMIENVNELPIELLVHIFSFLPSKDLIGVNRICKKWAGMVSDDNIWKEAFLKIWGRAPDLRLTNPDASWRDEYLARSRIVSPWSRRQPQKVQFNLEQVEDLGDCYFWRAKDGQPRFAAVSDSALLMATVESNRKLVRSVSYCSNNRVAFNHGAGLLATIDGTSVQIFSNSTLSGFTAVKTFSLESHMDAVGNRIDFLKWISNECLAIIVLNQWQKLIFANINDPTQVFVRPIERYVQFNPYSGRAELNNENYHKDEMCLILGSDVYWLNSKLILSSAPGWRPIPSTCKIFKLSERLLLRIDVNRNWSILSVQDLSETSVSIPMATSIVLSFPDTAPDCTRVLLTDEEGWQWMAVFKNFNESDLISSYEFIRFSQGLHDSSIEDVYFGKSVVIILRATVLAVHDAISLRLLFWQLVPHAKKDRAASMNNPSTRPDKRLLHVIEGEGIVLFEWTANNIQIWNFGRNIQAFVAASKPLQKTSHKKQMIESEIRCGYSEWREEKEAEIQMDRLRDKFNLDGMSEEEMLALAMSQSCVNQEESESISRQSSIVYEPSTDDEELRQVLQLSLHDK